MSTNERSQARCKVVLTIEVVPHDAWGDDCSIAQVRAQATRAAVGMVRGMLDAQIKGGTMRLVSVDETNVVTFQKAVAVKAESEDGRPL